jgi:hypothetical protein
VEHSKNQLEEIKKAGKPRTYRLRLIITSVLNVNFTKVWKKNVIGNASHREAGPKFF